MPDDQPGADYPPECRRLMELAMERVAAGDIPGAMKFQQRANACLRQHGIQAQDMPEEYFQLMHRGILAARRGDMREVERVRARMDEVLAMQPVEGEPGMPDECREILRRQQAAEDSGDWRQAIILSRDYNTCMRAHGLSDLDMPDEFFELQLKALAAQERGDMAEYQRCLAECQLLMQAHGIPTDGGPDATA